MSCMTPVMASVFSSSFVNPFPIQDEDNLSVGDFSSAFSTAFNIFLPTGQQFSSAFSSAFPSFEFMNEFSAAFSRAFAVET